MFPVEGQKLNFWNWTLSITKGLKTISAYVLECIFDMLKDILPALQIVTAASCPIVQWDKVLINSGSDFLGYATHNSIFQYFQKYKYYSCPQFMRKRPKS